MSLQLFDFKVSDRATFIQFLNVMLRDLKTHPEKWENNNLESFLEALSAYAEDIQGYYDNIQQSINAEEASWQVFADMLKGAVMYE